MLEQKQKNYYRLIQGDCLKVLPDLKDECADLIITDPPYNAQRKMSKPYRNKAKTRLSNREWFIYNDMSERIYLVWLQKLLRQLYRVLKMSCHLYVFSDWKTLRNLMDTLEQSYFCLNDLLVWNKVHFGIGFYYRPQTEFIIFASKGKPRKTKKNNLSNIFSIKRVSNAHTLTQKPESLIKQLIDNTTQERELILDPLLGSGTTMKVAQDLKRNCIGIEINPDYCEIVKKRCFGRKFLDREVEYKFEALDYK